MTAFFEFYLELWSVVGSFGMICSFYSLVFSWSVACPPCFFHICCQCLVICGLWTTNCETVNCKLWTANWELRTENWELRTENCKLRTENWELRTENWELQTENWELQTANCELWTTNKLPLQPESDSECQPASECNLSNWMNYIFIIS